MKATRLAETGRSSSPEEGLSSQLAGIPFRQFQHPPDRHATAIISTVRADDGNTCPDQYLVQSMIFVVW
jgi:hypothetical protein